MEMSRRLPARYLLPSRFIPFAVLYRRTSPPSGAPAVRQAEALEGRERNRLVAQRTNLVFGLRGARARQLLIMCVVLAACAPVEDEMTEAPAVEPTDRLDPEHPPLGGTNAYSRFSAPDSSLGALNANRPLQFPQPVSTGFGGNGAAQTWDGRIFVRTSRLKDRALAWYVSVLRPENIQVGNAGVPDFGAAFSNNQSDDAYVLEAQDKSPHQINWLAIVPDHRVAHENPYRSDALGNRNPSGTYETYKTFVYHTTKKFGSDRDLGLRPATFIVEHPKTGDARVALAEFTGEFQRLDIGGPTRVDLGLGILDPLRYVRGIEPTVTFDGRLLIAQGSPQNDGKIGSLVYSWNPNPNSPTGWKRVRSLSAMYSERNERVAGLPFAARYRLAQKPLLDATGRPYSQLDRIAGAYPWVSQDGSEVFFQASREVKGGSLRTAASVAGRWTGWTIRHIDGPINPDRHRTERLFFSSPGAFTTMWSPFRNVADSERVNEFETPASRVY